MRELKLEEVQEVNGGISGRALGWGTVAVIATAATGLGSVGIAIIAINAILEGSSGAP